MTTTQRFVARFVARDSAAISELFTEPVDCWWVSSVPGAPWHGPVRTRREVEAFFLSMHGALTLRRVVVHSLVADRSAAVLLGRMDADAATGGPALVIEFALALQLRERLIRELRWHLDPSPFTEGFDPRGG
ncbi:nuclear transport factor 2 family protein [Actinokineospora enzanensis]|uniref:nuclear transport factor 2 family protein n=1 Tax=Actinokineospora enzanensis TaxID=155975 RepID=UPI000372E005|nr:nuclear transport factor 2 family protein [Actinokineospora enzanensis]